MSMWIQDYSDIALMVIVCEAVVNIIFTGTILQPIRETIITNTPFLSIRDEHLLSCRLCTSLWVGALCGITLLYLHILAVRIIVLGIVIHRLSNHFHLVFSLIRDIQLDTRVRRNR